MEPAIRIEGSVWTPAEVGEFDGFRRRVCSDDFPQRGCIDVLQGTVEVGTHPAGPHRFIGRLRRIAPLLLACAFACALAWPSAVRARGGGQKWALVIGVDRYQHAQDIRALQFAGSDARAVRKALVEAAGFPPANVFLMTSRSGSPPTSENVLARLASLQALVQPGDTFVFYFSGHGAEKGNQRWLLTANTNPATTYTMDGTALEVSRIREIIESLRASRILELVDACADNPWGGARAAGTSRSTAGMARDLTLTASRAGSDLEAAVTILSCKPGQRSYEGYQGHGYFTYYLVAGLRGAARRDGVVTVPSLVSYLKRAVPRAVMVGESGHRQDPWVKADGASAFDWVLSSRGGTPSHHSPVAHVPAAAAPVAKPPEPASPAPPAVAAVRAMHFACAQRSAPFVRVMEGWVDDPQGLWDALAPLQPPPGAHGAYGLIGDDGLLGGSPGYGLRTLGAVARRYLRFTRFHYEQPSGWESLGVQAGTFDDPAALSDASLGWAFFDVRPQLERELKAFLGR